MSKKRAGLFSLSNKETKEIFCFGGQVMKLDDLVQGHPDAEDELKKLRDFVGHSVKKLTEEKPHYEILKEALEKCGIEFTEDKTNGGVKFIRVSNRFDFDFSSKSGDSFLRVDY